MCFSAEQSYAGEQKKMQVDSLEIKFHIANRGYQELKYAYIKKKTPESLKALMDGLSVIFEYYSKIDSLIGNYRIYPGIAADYGYLLMVNGNNVKGKFYLQKEVEFYPESAKFIENIIKNFEK